TALVHIKIDTGMCRLGFVPSPKAVLEILEINKLPNLQIDGVFTHFATSDEVDKTFTMEQKNKFVNMVTDLENKGVTFNKKHCSNSGAIMDFDNLCFNFVRAGIILYGLYPSDDVKKENLEIKPVMTVRARIVHIKEVEENTTIGYGRTFTTTAKRKIATVCLGYADGLPRALSNKGFLWLHNKQVPIVGRVCMDLCMVDVTEVENVTMEEEITFFGQVFSANEVGKMCGTIGYEVVCAISKRVPRIYKKN
ncbi:MAG: alanine racemase, partial [Anaerotignaceae bacterium]